MCASSLIEVKQVCYEHAAQWSENIMGALIRPTSGSMGGNTSIHCSGKERSIWLLWPEIIVAACLLINDLSNQV